MLLCPPPMAETPFAPASGVAGPGLGDFWSGSGGRLVCILVLLCALMMPVHFRLVALLRHQAAVMALGLRHPLLLVSRAHDLAVLFLLCPVIPSCGASS